MAKKAFLLALFTVTVAGAQSFEVASIKPNVPPSGERNLSRIEHSLNTLTMRNVDLTDCITWAYQIDRFQLDAGDNLKGKHFDILATAAAPVPVSQLRKMLQQLLADRFKLALRRESKTVPVYELSVAKGGPKLPSANTGGEDHHVHELLPHADSGSFVFPDTTMAEFAAKLSLLRDMDRPVIDKTGIEGYYNITLKGAAAALLQENGPSLFTLIPEQLGLKLMAAKAPIDFLIVDHVENPSAN